MRSGDEVSFSVGYRAMMGALSSPYVDQVYCSEVVA